MGARCASLGRSTAGHFSGMEAGSELKMNKTGKYEGKGEQIPCARDPLSKGTADVNLDPWVYLSIITYFNSRFQRKEQTRNLFLSILCSPVLSRHHYETSPRQDSRNP